MTSNAFKKKIDDMTKVIILRGLVSPNKKWWSVSDQMKDKTGIILFNEIINKKSNINCSFIPFTILDHTGYLVKEPKYIEEILNNSPHIFTVGKLKYKFFKHFMRLNVGVSTGCPWERRRKLNENVLLTDNIHEYANLYDQYI